MSLKLNSSGGGSVTLQEPTTANNQTLNLPDNSGTLISTASTGQVIPKAALPTGSVLQVVQTVLTSVFSWTTKGAWVDMTGVSASITPTSASSKILIQVMLTSGDGGNNYNRGYRLTKNGSVLTGAQGDSGVTSCIQASMMGISGPIASNDITWTAPIIYFDSPATTSAVTYGVQGFAGTSSVTTSYINRPYAPNGGAPSFNGITTVTLMEIAA